MPLHFARAGLLHRSVFTSLRNRLRAAILGMMGVDGKPGKTRKVKRAHRQPGQVSADLDRSVEFQNLCQMRERYMVWAREPLVLISQVQRSGGTLLSQLFDMHPECHAHPYELYIGYPDKKTWPVLHLEDNPDRWFDMLFEKPAERAFYEGYRKNPRGSTASGDTFPFLFVPSLQRRLFRHCVSIEPVATQRAILDSYMTSYFNAWLDNRNLYGAQKKYITAFVPRMIMRSESMENFFQDYPDGRLISIIREPKSWYVSARKHDPEEYGDLEQAMETWCLSTASSMEAKRRYVGKVHVILFEDLLVDTATTMESLAEFLGISFTPGLLAATFNGSPIKANSQFTVEQAGIIAEPLSRWKLLLTPLEVARIDAIAAKAYEEGRAHAHRPPKLRSLAA